MLKCPKHPKYEAKRAPTSDCIDCRLLWAVKQRSPIDPGKTDLDTFLESKTEDKIGRLEDDLRLAKARADSAEKRMHEAERLRESVFHLADTDLAIPDWLVEKSEAGDVPHVPVLVTSDFQWGEVIDRDNMDGINEYNVKIAQRRYRKLIEKTVDISTVHLPKNRYNGLVLLRLGDTVSGDIHDELRETNELSGVSALPSVVEAETWGTEQLADVFGNVHVVSVPGNHGRTTRKPPTKRIEENYDWLASCWLESSLKGDTRITWQTPRSTDAVFEAAGRRYLATHGDNIGSRGGQGFIGPAATIMRGMKKTLDEYARRGVHIDKIILGHFHTALDLGYGYANGSLPGYSEFARAGRMTPEDPQQWLLFLHPKHGVTSQWKVRV